MELSVLANLYGKKSLDETLNILTSLGVHTVEIGAYLVNNLISVLESVPDNEQAREVADSLMHVIGEYANSGQRSGDAASRMGNEVMLEPEEIL